MQLQPQNFYHLFNRGNNSKIIFPEVKNYSFFLSKAKKYLAKNCSIIAYCLMPNHFHFLIYFESEKEIGNFGKNLKIMLSSYTKAINNQEKRTGSLFQQNSKIKALKNDDWSAFTCFHYIHQNPLKAKIVGKMESWTYSSFKVYFYNQPSFINKELAFDLLSIPLNPSDFYEQSYTVMINYQPESK